MTVEEMEKKLVYLLDRQAIYDVMVRYCRGVDRLDRDLVLSAYHKDAVDDHAMFVGDRGEFWTWVEHLHSTYQTVTHHFIGNHSVEIDGNVAHAETYFIFGGMNREGAPFSLIGGRYVDRLEKREGVWGIVARNNVPDWSAPSINTVEGSKTPEGATNYNCLQPFEWKVVENGAPRSARDKTDASYARPLTVCDERRKVYKDIRREHTGT